MCNNKREWRAYYIAQPMSRGVQRDEDGYEIWEFCSQTFYAEVGTPDQCRKMLMDQIQADMTKQKISEGTHFVEFFYNKDTGRGYQSL